jgi:hypothetical protein
MPVTVDGVGGVTLLLTIPFQLVNPNTLLVNSVAYRKKIADNKQTVYFPYLSHPYISFSTNANSTSSITNSELLLNDQFFTSFRFPIFSNGLAGGSI